MPFAVSLLDDFCGVPEYFDCDFELVGTFAFCRFDGFGFWLLGFWLLGFSN